MLENIETAKLQQELGRLTIEGNRLNDALKAKRKEADALNKAGQELNERLQKVQAKATLIREELDGRE